MKKALFLLLFFFAIAARFTSMTLDTKKEAEITTINKDQRKGKDHAIFFLLEEYNQYADFHITQQGDKALEIELMLRDSYAFSTKVYRNLSKDSILKVLSEVKDLSFVKEEGSQLFVYFRGYGESLPNPNQLYFITFDSEIFDYRGRTTYLGLDAIKTALNNIPCNHIFLSMNLLESNELTLDKSKKQKCPEVQKPKYCLQEKMGSKSRFLLIETTSVHDSFPGSFETNSDHNSFPGSFETNFMNALESNGREHSDGILDFNTLLSSFNLKSKNLISGVFEGHECNSNFLFIPTKNYQQNEEYELFKKSGIMVDKRGGNSCNKHHVYRTARFKNKVMMVENLRYDLEDYQTLCYKQDPGNCLTHGRYYSKSAAEVACPKSWKIPSDKEWEEFIQEYGHKRFSMKPKKGDAENPAVLAYENLVEKSTLVQLSGFESQAPEGFKDMDEKIYFWSSSYPKPAKQDTNRMARSVYFSFKEKVVDYTDLLKSTKASCRCILTQTVFIDKTLIRKTSNNRN